MTTEPKQLKDKTYTNEDKQYIKRGPNKQQYNIKHAKIYDRKSSPGLVAFYYIQPGNGAGLFLQPRNPHGADMVVHGSGEYGGH